MQYCCLLVCFHCYISFVCRAEALLHSYFNTRAIEGAQVQNGNNDAHFSKSKIRQLQKGGSPPAWANKPFREVEWMEGRGRQGWEGLENWHQWCLYLAVKKNALAAPGQSVPWEVMRNSIGGVTADKAMRWDESLCCWKKLLTWERQVSPVVKGSVRGYTLSTRLGS